MRSRSNRPHIGDIGVGCALALLSGSALADVRLPAIFSDHMVLQRNAHVSIWGWADVGEDVTVSIAGQTREAITASDGKWRVTFDNPSATRPLAVTVKGKNEIVVNDVLIGEVWLASGQSNMVVPVSSALNFPQEKATSDMPLIRVFKEQSESATSPRAEPKGQWVVCSPQTVAQFPATSFFFGRELHRELGAPVGIINSAVGGTPIEAWIPVEVQRAAPELQPFFKILDKIHAERTSPEAIARYERALKRWQKDSEKARQENRKPRRRPKDPREASAKVTNVAGLFNGKIAPLIPYGIRGVIWYQGESNTMPLKAPFYRHQLPLLVKSWRSRWGT
jgi:sialate O-acetylesterase